MIELTAVSDALTALNALKGIAKAAIGLRDAAADQGKVIEFQDKIIAAQEAINAVQLEQSALLNRIRELEAQVADFENWEAEKQRYKLHDFGGGTFAYLLKEDMRDGEPPHRICANCFQKGHKSILQSWRATAGHQDHYVCTACKTDFYFGPAHFSSTTDQDSWLDD